MKAENLHDLLENNLSARRYFSSLPIHLQMILHGYNDVIRNPETLHTYVKVFQRQRVVYKEQ